MAASGLLLAVVTLVVVANAANVPPKWKTCKRSLPPAEYDPCMNNAVKDTIDDLLLEGAPTLSIPPLEPLKISSITISQGNGPVAVDINMWDIEISNLYPWQLKNLRTSEIDHYKFGAEVVNDKPVLWKSKYEMNGKVLVLPINGKGDCKFELENFHSYLNFSGVPYTKKGETYMNVTEIKYDYDTDKVHLHFDNLFNGNKQLGDNMNVFLNENWAMILNELKPALAEGLGQSIKGVAAQVFNRIAYKKLFPE